MNKWSVVGLIIFVIIVINVTIVVVVGWLKRVDVVDKCVDFGDARNAGDCIVIVGLKTLCTFGGTFGCTIVWVKQISADIASRFVRNMK